MDYGNWVRGELAGLSKSLGFRYTAQYELEGRLNKLKVGMNREGIGGLSG